MNILILATAFVQGASAATTSATPTGDLVFEPAYFAEAAPVTALDMVRRVPGFVIDSGDAVRGFAGAAGNVLVDGVRPSTKNRTIDDVLTAIPAAQVMRIELIRTPRPGLDQQGTQLLVNVVRVAEESRSQAVTLSNYSYAGSALLPSLRGEMSRRNGKGGWEASYLLSLNQDESGEGERITRLPDGTVLDRAKVAIDSPIRGAEARLAGDTGFAGGVIRGNLSFTHQDYRTHEVLDFLEGPLAGSMARTDDAIRTNSGEAGAEWSRSFVSNLSAKLLVLATRKDVSTRSASEGTDGSSLYRADSVADERILRATLARSPGSGVAWEINGEVAYNALDSQSAFEFDGVPVTLPNSDVRIAEWRGDAFAKLTIPLSPRLTAEATARGEYSSLGQTNRVTDFDYTTRFGFFKPKLLLRWDAGKRSQIRLRLEREVGQLDFTDFASSASLIDGTVNAGNLDLRPQTAWIGEVAAERRFGKDGVVTLTYRHHRIDNVLDLIPVEGLDAPGNIGRGHINALGAQVTWPLDPLGISGGRVSFSGEWRSSQVRDPVDGLRRPITALAPFVGEIHATLDRPALRSSFAIDVYFGQELTYRRLAEWRQTSDEPYVSLKWTYTASPRLTIEASAQNILGRKRERDRIAYGGTRAGGAVLLQEERWYRSTTGLFLSLRRQL